MAIIIKKDDSIQSLFMIWFQLIFIDFVDLYLFSSWIYWKNGLLRDMWSHWRYFRSNEARSHRRKNGNTKEWNVLLVWSLTSIQRKFSELSAQNIDIDRLKAVMNTCSILFDTWAAYCKDSVKMKKTHISYIDYKSCSQWCYANCWKWWSAFEI